MKKFMNNFMNSVFFKFSSIAGWLYLAAHVIIYLYLYFQLKDSFYSVFFAAAAAAITILYSVYFFAAGFFTGAVILLIELIIRLIIRKNKQNESGSGQNSIFRTEAAILGFLGFIFYTAGAVIVILFQVNGIVPLGAKI